jgi:hypothetical protein
MKLFVIFLLKFALSTALFSSLVFAQETAVREPNENWQSALARAIRKNPTSFENWARGQSVTSSAKLYKDGFDVSTLPQWYGTDAELLAAFQKLRDERPYVQSNRPTFPRRASWLYPQDGCYARAAHSARSFEKDQKTRPGKVFAFGNLKMKTDFGPHGVVYWSYHVAAAFRIGDQAIVLDPSAEPSRPLLLQEWLGRMNSRPQNIRVAICDTYAYSPGSICVGGSANQENNSVSHQVSWLPREWNWMISLKKNPELILGSQPPWVGAQPVLTPVAPIRDVDHIRN